ncbi:MAG: TonB-dependent receptor, partial [Caulobacter sp.]
MHSPKARTLRARLITGGALVALMAAGSAHAQTASDNTDVAVDEVIVTGFRSSLEKALNIKRESAAAVDAIYAEDMAKFPDLNLSESIQRIPGVAISRDAGEGRNISVRGLGAQFTRVRINGMEALTTSGGTDASGGTNRSRSFDFNVFASDLFNRITVQKTASAETEEGSLGATVDLQTAHPFDKPGFNFAVSGKYGYNDISEKARPRVAALISNTWRDDTFGALLSVAYSERYLLDQGASTVRWQTGTATAPGFRSVRGVTCATNAAACAEANAAVHPRIPRFDWYKTQQERLGATGSLQWQPSDRTLLTFDALYANFQGERNESFLETFTPQTAGACTATSPVTCGINQVDVLDYTIATPRAGFPVMTTGRFNNIDLKSEQRYDKLKTEFRQFTLVGEHEITDRLKVKGTVGLSKSTFANPIQNTVQWDQYNVQGYTWDYTGSNYPVITYGSGNVTSPDAWTLAEIRMVQGFVDNTYKTAQFDASYDWSDNLKIKAGLVYKAYGTESAAFARSNGTTANINPVAATNPLTAVPRSSYGQLVELKNLSLPAGNASSWITPDIKQAMTALNMTDPNYGKVVTTTPGTVWTSPFGNECFTSGCGIYRLGREPSLGSNYEVDEWGQTAYLQGDFNFQAFGMPVRGDVGVRYVKTRQKSLGYGVVPSTVNGVNFQTISATTATRSYDDVLPALNLVVEPREDFLVRFGAAKVMARPNLGNLTPGVNIGTGSNKTVTSGNPFLEPFRAKTVDLSFEWYFQPQGLISAAFFYKDISTFVQSYTSPLSTFDQNPFGLPDSAAVAACGTTPGCAPSLPVWQFSTSINTPGGPLKGFELNYQQPFTFLPGPFDDFGFLGNVTFVDSEVTYLSSTGAVTAIGQLTNLSKTSYNATLYYENSKFSSRVSAAYRSKYLTQIPGRNGSDVEGTASTLNIDASATWTVNDSLAFTFEAVNLTNEVQDQYYDSSRLLSFYHETGREFFVGFRYTF